MLLQALLVHINERRALWIDEMVVLESSKDLFYHQYLRWVRFLYDEQHLFCILDEMPTYYGEDCYDIKPAFTLKEALRRCKEDGLIVEGDIDEQLVLINTRLMGFARWIHEANFILFDVYMVSHMNAIWDLLKRK